MVALVVRATYALLWSRYAIVGFDASSYYELGKSIAVHGSYELRTPKAEATALFPPGFPFFLAVGRLIGFGTRTKMLLWAAGLGTVTVVMIGVLARRIVSPKVGLVAAAIAALYPNLWLADGALMTETLTGALVVAALYLVTELRSAPRPSIGVALGMVLLWLSLTRSDGLIIALLCCASVIAAARRGSIAVAKTGFVAGVCAIVIPLVGIGLWQLRVQNEMDAFVPIAVNSWTVVAGANCEATYYGDRIGTWELPCVKTVEAFAEHQLQGEIAQNRYARDQGAEYARDHLQRLPLVAVARLGRAFGVYDPWRELKIESLFESRSVSWSRAGYIMYLAMMPCAVFGWFSARRRKVRDVGLLLIPVVAVIISVIVGYGNHRFRMPLEPCLVVLSAMGLHELVHRRVNLIGTPK